jgi:hypothetical protein
MLPLNAGGTLGALSRHIPAAIEVNLVPAIATTAIELDWVLRI